MRILRNKKTKELYEFQDNEAPTNQDEWDEINDKDISDYKKEKIKADLLRIRRDFLNQSLMRALEYLVDNYDNPEKDKRIQAKKEIEEIESCKTITALKQFNLDFE